MRKDNQMAARKFNILGLGDLCDLQSLLFGIFLLISMVTVFGNLLIVTVLLTDHNLHIPMYFFLSHFSFLDICYMSTMVSKMLKTLLNSHEVISLWGCAAWLCLFSILGVVESFLL